MVGRVETLSDAGRRLRAGVDGAGRAGGLGGMDAITFAIAVLGAALGLVNLWREIDRSRVKLRVIPKGWIDTEGGHGLSVEVVNRGEYAVTLVAVGVQLRGDEKLEWQFLAIDRARCPHRLEPRDSVSFRARAGAEKDDKLRRLGRRAFVRTACGVVATGDSPFLRSICTK